MRYSHALRLVPGLYWWKAENAFVYASWTRSSASAGFRAIRMAAEYSWSTYCIASRSKRTRRSSSVSVEVSSGFPSTTVSCAGSGAAPAGLAAGVLLGLASFPATSCVAATAGSMVLIAFKSTVTFRRAAETVPGTSAWRTGPAVAHGFPGPVSSSASRSVLSFTNNKFPPPCLRGRAAQTPLPACPAVFLDRCDPARKPGPNGLLIQPLQAAGTCN